VSPKALRCLPEAFAASADSSGDRRATDNPATLDVDIRPGGVTCVWLPWPTTIRDEPVTSTWLRRSGVARAQGLSADPSRSEPARHLSAPVTADGCRSACVLGVQASPDSRMRTSSILSVGDAILVQSMDEPRPDGGGAIRRHLGAIRTG
jgi:hypothetical protein